ncbi:hypothetical protein DQ384_26150 [Sphaerisporangium album]|uniref:Uncharacterized protein n=1 Tax=Sphaerisporangium album TaxID=509200 RepID=A0A367FA26_9ACTN|nr:hypothetical protein [Sphaerisporangium album]RCG27204.1 hypothetical protein DQ384_26150 [Sphaerisporangium album]
MTTTPQPNGRPPKPPARHNDPDCLACAHPDQLPDWLNGERTKAAELLHRAQEVRVQAVQADAAVLAAVGWQDIMAAQREQRRLHGEANALAQSALIIQAHADRVEAAHPRPVENVQLPPFDLFEAAS